MKEHARSHVVERVATCPVEWWFASGAVRMAAFWRSVVSASVLAISCVAVNVADRGVVASVCYNMLTVLFLR